MPKISTADGKRDIWGDDRVDALPRRAYLKATLLDLGPAWGLKCNCPTGFDYLVGGRDILKDRGGVGQPRVAPVTAGRWRIPGLASMLCPAAQRGAAFLHRITNLR